MYPAMLAMHTAAVPRSTALEERVQHVVGAEHVDLEHPLARRLRG